MSEMINICEDCAEDQKIPIIKKPTYSQLTQADKTYSVRERLDRMSGRRDSTEISSDQLTTQRNLARLKMPKTKQNHPEILDNYYWEVNIARRRAKMTTGQLAKKVDTTSNIIQDIERGIIPKDFQEIFLKLEALFGIKLLKARPQQINFLRKNTEQEKAILAAVASKRSGRKANEYEDIEEVDSPKSRNLRRGEQPEEIKASKKEDLSKVTLNDLIDRKRAREKYQMQSKQNEMMGDEIDLDEL
ncbi:hypothetical protein J4226_03580 [Candidatus Pacearchaeota archaeon]|nr:hypothetical protein [Candidatus Pacearchaeota archaeon]